ncbi:MAG: hypothetical protein RIS70_1123 [Planctomycetota bacterium]|jgi:hypothetical protein
MRFFRRRAGASNLKWLALLCLVMIVAGAVMLGFRDREPVDFSGVKATSGRITAAQDDGDDHPRVNRRKPGELWYRVTLDPAPIGNTMPIECEWTGPDQKVTHRNRYQTKRIVQTPWETHARFAMTGATATGRWTVRMTCQGNVLHSKEFEIVDEDESAEQ